MLRYECCIRRVSGGDRSSTIRWEGGDYDSEGGGVGLVCVVGVGVLYYLAANRHPVPSIPSLNGPFQCWW